MAGSCGSGGRPLNDRIAFHGGNVLRFALFFGLGTFAFHRLPELPGWPWLALATVLIGLVWGGLGLRPWLAAPIGFAWAHLYTLAVAPPALPADGATLRMVADGRVISLVEHSAHTARFVFEVRSIAGPSGPRTGRWRVRLSWRDPPELRPGDALQLGLRLKAAHGYAAPGAWDYEGWLYWQGIRYTGYVDPESVWRRLPGTPCCRLNRVRGGLAGAIDRLPLSGFSRGVIRALVVGDQSALSPQAEALFRATGTSHLMAISGLHIGLLAGLGLVGVAWLWRRTPRLCEQVPARVAGAVAGLIAALIYALLAGMSLPTQRALIMLSVFTCALLSRRASGPSQALALAAVGVLLWHPPSILSAGFWLSFGAVATILATLSLASREAYWRSAIRVQLALSLALWPVVAAFGMPASGVAPLVNLLLVPLFGFLVIPISLLGTALLALSTQAGTWLLQPLGLLLDLVRQGLISASEIPWSGPLQADTAGPALLAYGCAVGLLFSPHGAPFRGLAPVLLAVPWLPSEPQLEHGAYQVQVLDVGQGLSVVVETRLHTLVFDTGPQFPSGFSTAKAVLVPFLAARRTSRIDRLVLSHGDKDHAGDAAYIVERLDVVRVQSGEPARVGVGAERCVAGEHWSWDGVSFRFTHPAATDDYSGNNASCVLRIGNAAGTTLLTGDVEEPVERRLVAAAVELDSDLVVAPHHGSRSSSSQSFVDATRPAYVVYTAGWANRYGFPASVVDQRWRSAGAIPLNTALLGTLRFRFTAGGAMLGPYAHRLLNKRFWSHSSGSAAPPHAVSSIHRSSRP